MHGRSWALARAKSNIDRFFPVVAVLERLDESMAVMEARLPKYFKLVSKYYKMESSRSKLYKA